MEEQNIQNSNEHGGILKETAYMMLMEKSWG